MSRIRLASLYLVVAFVFQSFPAFAQGPNSVTARLAEIEARLDKLEGNITSADLVGTTYALAWINIPLTGHTATQSASIKMDGVTGTLTLSAGGSASLVLAGCSVVLTEPTWALTDLGCGGDTATGTWTYANGILTTDIGQYDFDFNVGLGGRLLTTAAAFFHAGDPSSDAGIIIGSRLQ